MKQILLGSLAGGIILFVWGVLAWAVLPLHDSSFRRLANEEPIVSALQSNIMESGLYYFPGMPQEPPDMSREQREANMEMWMKKHEEGPIGLIVYHPRGVNPMMVGQFVSGLVIFLIAAFIASWFVSRSTAAASSYIARVAYCGMLGVFVSFISYISNMNWLYFPMDYTTGMVADTIIGWLLAGLAIAAIVKAPKMDSEKA